MLGCTQCWGRSKSWVRDSQPHDEPGQGPGFVGDHVGLRFIGAYWEPSVTGSAQLHDEPGQGPGFVGDHVGLRFIGAYWKHSVTGSAQSHGSLRCWDVLKA